MGDRGGRARGGRHVEAHRDYDYGDQQSSIGGRGGSSVLLLTPNVIDYLRILLIVAAFVGYQHPVWFVPVYTTAALLDWVDGFAARKLDQDSVFGAYLDVVVDLISRGLLWCWLTPYGYAVTCVEWLTFVSTHSAMARRKAPQDDFPKLVSLVMSHDLQSVWGTLAVCGLHFLPLWIYSYQSGFLSWIGLGATAQLAGLGLLGLSRVMCLYVEMFYICSHIRQLLAAPSTSGVTSAAHRDRKRR